MTVTAIADVKDRWGRNSCGRASAEEGKDSKDVIDQGWKYWQLDRTKMQYAEVVFHYIVALNKAVRIAPCRIRCSSRWRP